jgi:hypothetical protein
LGPMACGSTSGRLNNRYSMGIGVGRLKLEQSPDQ